MRKGINRALARASAMAIAHMRLDGMTFSLPWSLCEIERAALFSSAHLGLFKDEQTPDFTAANLRE